MISVLSIPRRYVLGDPQVGMSELSLNDRQRHAFAIHLNGVRVPELVIVPTSAQASLGRPDLKPSLARESVHVGISGICSGFSARPERFELPTFGSVGRR